MADDTQSSKPRRQSEADRTQAATDSQPDGHHPTQSEPTASTTSHGPADKATLEHLDSGVIIDEEPFLLAANLYSAGRFGAVFSHVNLRANQGDLVALTGEAGTGHTALLLALSGRWKLTSGDLTVNGDTAPRRIRRHVTIANAAPAVNCEDFHTIAHLITETRAVTAGEATKTGIATWMERLEVQPEPHQTFALLPRVEQTLLLIALGAACGTPVLAVDDVDAGLSTEHANRVFDALRLVADHNILVLASCVRQDPPADTVLTLDQPTTQEKA
ncbi:ABC transporter ATP-binding protein [Natronoglycomyces albus]|uniref:ATP-binding cassette domain-containing protein n=1 Tax=Natronoglycomyces albus TaxID=2811108 RepID=A0A895XSI9_9ACTN|nr:ABC transporter ATP-binding protein [Natronoglycomyces albus]QSB05230.1 ATP-binding cassette domain-containing protein [Natronoglycomyces albus]